MKKLAVVIGINYLKSFKPLKGCFNDAKGFTKLLVEKFHFSLSDIQILLEEDATRQNILNAIDHLIQELKPGDIGVLTFHGHGAQTTDRLPHDEEDMFDEVIIPYDGIDDSDIFPDNVIRDDEIKERLNNIQQNVHFTLIFDSCNSETVTRSLQSTRVIPPSVSVIEIKHLMADLKTSRSLPKHHSFSGENYYLLAACKDDQEARDDEINGYFTGELLRYIEPGITYEQLKAKVVPAVKERTSNEQEPQFEGSNLSLPIFGIKQDSMSPTIKFFKIDILLTEIIPRSDGSIVIRNEKLTDLFAKLQEKVIKDLIENNYQTLIDISDCTNNYD